MAKWSDETVRAALAGRNAMRRVPFPGAPKVEVMIRILTDAELDNVRLRAVETVKKRKAELVLDPEFLDRLIHRETIAAAFYDAEHPTDAFFSSEEEVAELDNLTVRGLYELYMTHVQALDPYSFCPLEEVQELAETLGKSENSVGILNLYDGPTLRSFCLSLALRLRELEPSPTPK
jgi:hypothetical protein